MAGASGTFRVLLRMTVHPGTADEFERVWTRVGGGVTGHPASLGQWLARSAQEEDVYYVVSDWADEPSFREMEYSGRHVTHRSQLDPYRSGTSMTTMYVVRHLPGPS